MAPCSNYENTTIFHGKDTFPLALYPSQLTLSSLESSLWVYCLFALGAHTSDNFGLWSIACCWHCQWWIRSNLDRRETSEPGSIPFICFQMGSRLRSAFWVLIVLVGLLGFWGIGSDCAENRRPKNVQVAVRAKWSGTPLLLEAGYAAFPFLLFLLFAFS